MIKNENDFLLGRSDALAGKGPKSIKGDYYRGFKRGLKSAEAKARKHNPEMFVPGGYFENLGE